ncbi:Protein-S-isoprenylcysteine O-methyltransferase Ste14 [Atopostipes suicloacalis DSM 15692]|uniref:Protein-S-isoprenylcysteine O-methyltransferase Ste14 n=2 Tax=Atopostipes suicloacalis TaxID=180295 RepID=A0A1M4SM27_9LACT|nr:Protein-S-isoprenylcysteine O-methyltransferase Ste14 [Atopostipes suicloacalis DSM 15692]
MKTKNLSFTRFCTSGGILMLTVFFLFLSRTTDLLVYFKSTQKIPNLLFILFGILFMGIGSFLGYKTKKQFKTDQEVVRGSHSSRGVYSNVRNPIYSSVFLFSTGVLLTTRNFLSLFIIGLNWFIFTAVIIFIEEPRLIDKLDRDYIEYTIQVNRLIPWFSQHFKTREFTSKDKILLENAEKFFDKEIITPVMGIYFLTLPKIFWFRKGICFITDKEIGFYSYDVFRGHYGQLIPFEKISSFVYGKSNAGYSLRFHASNTSINLYFIQKGDFKKFIEHTKERINL